MLHKILYLFNYYHFDVVHEKLFKIIIKDPMVITKKKIFLILTIIYLSYLYYGSNNFLRNNRQSFTDFLNNAYLQLNNYNTFFKVSNFEGSDKDKWSNVSNVLDKESIGLHRIINDTDYFAVYYEISKLLSFHHEVYKKTQKKLKKLLKEVERNRTNVLCPTIPNNLVGRMEINITSPSWEELLDRESNRTKLGGRSWPTDCHQPNKLAIIVCYRNREDQLRTFLSNLHPFLRKQNLDYTIVVVEQMKGSTFNRGLLFNIGFIETKKLFPATNCFIFHDVDLIPEDDRNLYICGDFPRHLTVSIDTHFHKLQYETLFGGATAFTGEQFVGAFGFSNEFWGWGGEDDDLYSRVVKVLGSRISRYPKDIARYKMIRHTLKESAPINPHRSDLILLPENKYLNDGLHTTKYNLKSIHLLSMVRILFYIYVIEFHRRFIILPLL
ncbi:hypothetical protein SNEBB_010044 [Seison nebaliae]|nr:hypothetical protein SNEBB_010044 [Seison nebaliae]